MTKYDYHHKSNSLRFIEFFFKFKKVFYNKLKNYLKINFFKKFINNFNINQFIFRI